MIWKIWLQLLTFYMSVKVTPKKIIQYIESHTKTHKNNTEFVTPETIRMSCVQMKMQKFDTLEAYLSQLLELVQTAVEAGSQMIVFPELTGLLAGTMIPGWERILRWMTNGKAGMQDLKFIPARLQAVTDALQGYFYESYLETFGALARTHHVYIVAGSCLFYEQGKLYNRSVVLGPDGQPAGYQDKTTLGGIDCLLGVTPGEQMNVIPTSLGKLAIGIGSDHIYFETMQIAKAAGAKLFAAPSLDTGISAELLRCRANQFRVYLVSSQFITGKYENLATGIYCPDELAKTNEGTLIHAVTNGTGVLTTRINLSKLELLSSYPASNTVFMHGDYLSGYLQPEADFINH